jgi:hypothetical protein
VGAAADNRVVDAKTPPALPARLFCCVLVAGLSACSPALDWRDARSADGAVRASFPCKPRLHERRLALAGAPVVLAMQACSAGGQTWALVSADLADPARVTPALLELAAAAAGNIGAEPVAQPLQVPGATPNAASQRLRLDGQRPDGQALRTEVGLFTHGTHVYQATVLGPAAGPEALDSFFGALRVQH